MASSSATTCRKNAHRASATAFVTYRIVSFVKVGGGGGGIEPEIEQRRVRGETGI
jgi:hypothetical protein